MLLMTEGNTSLNMCNKNDNLRVYNSPGFLQLLCTAVHVIGLIISTLRSLPFSRKRKQRSENGAAKEKLHELPYAEKVIEQRNYMNCRTPRK